MDNNEKKWLANAQHLSESGIFDSIMEKKYNLFEWYARTYDDTTGHARMYIRSLLDVKYPVHVGQCTQDPCSCDLCILEGLLTQYAAYYLKESNK